MSTERRRWGRWVAVVIAGLLVVAGVLAGRVAWLRAQHRQLREAEVGRAPVVPPKRAGPAVSRSTPVLSPCSAEPGVRGVVLDRGVPVAEAQVSLSSPDAPGLCSCPGCRCQEGLSTILETPRAGLAVALRSVTSSADGTFELCSVGRGEGRFLFAEHADGRVAVMQDEQPLQPGVFVTLEVQQAMPVTGVVLGLSGPLGGVKVVALPAPGVAATTFTTDASGRFSARLPPGSTGFVVGVRDGQARFLTETVSPGALLVLRIDEPGSLVVRALARGTPVKGAQVRLGSEPARDTDEQGEVRFASLSSEADVAVRVRAGALTGRATVRVLPGSEQRLDLGLERGVIVRGVVVDEKGQPRLGRVRGLEPAPVEVDAQGRFVSEPLEPNDDVYLTAEVEGCTSERRREVELGEADVAVVLNVRCGVTVSGQVLDAEGAPVVGAEVAGSSSDESESVQTGPKGLFALHLPPGPAKLTVTHPRFRESTTPLTSPKQELVIVLDAGGSIAGRVVDARGAGLPNVEVTVIPAVIDELDQLLAQPDAKTDPDGRFELTRLLAGRYVVRAAGPSVPSTPSETVVLQPGEHRQGVVITVDGKVDLTGRVVDERSQPVPGARVTWSPADEGAAMRSMMFDYVAGRPERLVQLMPSDAYTDADGRFSLSNVGVDALKVSVRATAFADAELQARRGDKLEVVLRRVGGRIRGRAVDERGQPLDRFTVDDLDFTPADGRFEVQVTASETSIRVEARGRVSASRQVVLDQPVKDVGDVTLAKGRSMSFLATTADGAPLEGVRIAAAQLRGDVSSCTTSAAGTCSASPFLEGEEATVKARKDGYTRASVTVDAASLFQPVKVVLEAAGGRVTGVVTSAGGRPSGGQSVSVYSPSSSHFGLSDEQGRFTVTGVPEGPACVEVSLSGLFGSEWAMPVQVSSAGAPIELGPMRGGGALEVAETVPTRVVLLQGRHEEPEAGSALDSISASTLCEVKQARAVVATAFGSLRLEGVPPGTWTAFVLALNEANEGPVTGRVVEVLPGATAKVR